MRHDASPPHPGVRFPPPLLFVAGLLMGWLLETRVERIRLAEGGAAARWLEIAGALLLAAGLALDLWGVATFRRSGTTLIPNRAAARLVTAGPYRFTRNPMYTGLTTVYVGLSLLANAGWPLLLLPLVLAALYLLVIRREERYLATAFGDDYGDYRRRVRRWL
ncbi:MAG TPA: isoprenylcysteine carboxylmethyltransferase family protein [Gemmatimonadaceae bacterium]|nr:isoprenylcysteine carboxylmethyltransferase family protein [Gemmatimonadaceae bacterium]